MEIFFFFQKGKDTFYLSGGEALKKQEKMSRHIHMCTYTQRGAQCLACPREIKSQLRGRKTNLEGQTKHLSSCVCLVGK